MIDLNSLAIFAKVVETRSFSEAAKRLNIPISTVSRRVAELEDQLGVGLLERSTRNLRLTDIGAEVFEHAQRSAEISEAVGSIVSNQSSTVAGVLRLSAPPSISDTLLRRAHSGAQKDRSRSRGGGDLFCRCGPADHIGQKGAGSVMPPASIGSLFARLRGGHFRCCVASATTSAFSSAVRHPTISGWPTLMSFPRSERSVPRFPAASPGWSAS